MAVAVTAWLWPGGAAQAQHGHGGYHGGGHWAGGNWGGWGGRGWVGHSWYGGRGWYGSPYYGLGLGMATPYYSYGYYGYPYGYSSAYYYPLTTYNYYYPSEYYYPTEDFSGTVTTPALTPAETTAPQDNRGHLIIRVPSDGKVWFDGEPTRQTGEEREFVTPPLTPGRDYTYDVRVQAMENGRNVDEHRTVHVSANMWSDIDLMPQAMSTTPQATSTAPPATTTTPRETSGNPPTKAATPPETSTTPPARPTSLPASSKPPAR
jgi:uncharacterized protein (TIGR03000 family)